MELKIILNNDSRDVVGFLKVRKNITHKTKIQKIKEYISKDYNCNVTKMIPTGSINCETGESNISYLLFGDNLPFKNIRVLEV